LDRTETSHKEHGRVVRRELETTTRLAGHLDWPGVAQVCRLVRTTRERGRDDHVEVEYGITSVPRDLANAAQLLAWKRGHWGIENRSHYVRDVTMGEDASRIRTGSAPQNMAALRNAILNLLRSQKCVNVAATLRNFAYHPWKLFLMLGILKN
jgi:predicted transposase YbfD/YdcC